MGEVGVIGWWVISMRVGTKPLLLAQLMGCLTFRDFPQFPVTCREEEGMEVGEVSMQLSSSDARLGNVIER